jgi:ribosome-associated protein
LKKDKIKMEKPKLTELIPEITFKTSRSGGSGGQHVNKVSTKVELNFTVLASKILSEEQKQRILEKCKSKINSEGVLQLFSQSEKSQLRNKKRCLEKLDTLLETSFFEPKKRIKTKQKQWVKENRLNEKKIRSEIKKMRNSKFDF